MVAAPSWGGARQHATIGWCAHACSTRPPLRGLFLIPLGGITLLVRAGVLDASRLDEAWRLWPLVLIGLGLAIILGRTRAANIATVVIALGLGTLAGAILAGGSAWIGAFSGCGQPLPATAEHLVRDGAFDPGAAVRVELNCGSVSLATTGQTGWRLDAAHRGPAPLVDSGPARLDVRVPSGGGDRRNDWTLALPAATVGSIDVTANAATATLDLSGDLSGTHLATLDAAMNAGDLRIEAASARIDDLSLTMNAGRIRFAAGSTAMRGDVSLNAGAFDLCVPDGPASSSR